MLPGRVDAAVGRYLRIADRLLPGRVVGLYVVGGTALDAYRPNHSDIDVVVVLDRGLERREIRRLRLLHIGAGALPFVQAIRRRQPEIPGTVNAAFVRAEDLDKPVSAIEPVASHVGQTFAVGRAFDVNPVGWSIFTDAGIAVRGAEPDTLGLQPEPERLRDWNLANLDDYWRGWGEAARSGRGLPLGHVVRSHWSAAWGALGAPRLHHTVATGKVISKEAAGEYALDVFDAEWHPLIWEALAYWRDDPLPTAFPDRRARTKRAGEFVLEVVASAHALVALPQR